MTLPSTIDVTVEVSLDGSGAYTGAHDDVTAAVAVDPGIEYDEGREGARALNPPKVPSLGYELHNESGAYSPENAGGVAYQLLIPGRPTRVTATHGVEGDYDEAADYDEPLYYDGRASRVIASGGVDDIGQTTDFGHQRVRLDSMGTMGILVHQAVTVAVQANVRTDQAIALLLDAAGWPAGLRALSVGDTTLAYWWCDERPPWEAILELLASEGPCQLYQDADGIIHFENRNYRTITPRSTTSQASFADVDTGGLWFVGLSYDPGFKNIYNRATYVTRRRALGSLGKVWEYGATLTLTANESVTLIIRPSDANPFQDAVTPVAATDYTVSAGSLSSVTLSASSGLVAFLTLVAGASGATVNGVTSTGIQLRAKPLTVVSETVVQNGVDASASIAKYSPIPGGNVPRTLAVQGWPEIEPVGAQAVCNAWVNRYKEQHPQVSIAIRNADGDHVQQILERQVSDRITLTDANTGLAAAVWIETKQTTISGAGGRRIACVLGCELVDVLTGAIWDVSLWDNAAAVWGT
jgi:hypothetical protein